MKLSYLFENINKIKKPLAPLTKKKKERTQINKIVNERDDITEDTTDMQGIVRDYYEKLYTK